MWTATDETVMTGQITERTRDLEPEIIEMMECDLWSGRVNQWQ